MEGLEAKNLIERRRSPEDRRRHMVELTEAGATLTWCQTRKRWPGQDQAPVKWRQRAGPRQRASADFPRYAPVAWR